MATMKMRIITIIRRIMMTAIFATLTTPETRRGEGWNVCGKVREGARNRSLMKKRVEQVRISAHTGVIHATIIALISKRASTNNALPRIDLTVQEKGIYTEERWNMEAEVQSRRHHLIRREIRANVCWFCSAAARSMPIPVTVTINPYAIAVHAITFQITNITILGRKLLNKKFIIIKFNIYLKMSQI